jgi:hypothetical protein
MDYLLWGQRSSLVGVDQAYDTVRLASRQITSIQHPVRTVLGSTPRIIIIPAKRSVFDEKVAVHARSNIKFSTACTDAIYTCQPQEPS